MGHHPARIGRLADPTPTPGGDVSAPDRERAISALHALDPGVDREQWVRIGMSAKDAGVSLADFDTWSSRATNYSGERDVAQVWKSFNGDGVKAATLYGMAIDAGWKDPAKQRHNGHSKRQAITLTASPIRPQKTPHKAVKSVSELWAHFAPATDEHAYIIAKRGRADGLRVVPAADGLSIAGQSVAGWLVVPALSLDGELRSMQFIPPPGIGKKLNMPGASFDDGLFVVGNLAESARAFILEGIGQTWACWQATGCAAVVTFGSGRMSAVAEILRRRFPALPLVLVADRGKEVQCSEIARAIGGAWAEMPTSKPSNFDCNDYAAEYGADELAELLDKPKAPARRYLMLSAFDLLNAPPLRWLVRGVMPMHGLACMYGASGSGKSFLALDLCAAVADGAEWFCCHVTAAPVVYIALEGEHGFRQRVDAWQVHHGRDLPAGLRFVMQPFDLRNADDLRELADSVTASGAAGGLLVLDTLSRASGAADENSSKDMGEIVSAAAALQSKLGGTVLLIHHTGKDATKGLRGHSSLFAALDSAIEVARTDDRRAWRIAKSKDDSDSAAHSFRLAVVEIGADEHGDALTSCIVELDEDAGEAVRSVRLPRGGNQKAVFDVAAELLRDGKHMGEGGAPATRPCVRLDDLIAGCRGRLAVENDRVPERVRLAVTGLVNGGCVKLKDGWIWMP
ncbi:MAG: AAA family ATPase [Sterolibacterium sp.]